MAASALTAQLSAFHTANADHKCDSHNPFTVYVVTVKKGAQHWQVYRRYREWEDLRIRLIQQLGSAPPMPPKQLFGRMRPEVIENRVLGLNHFLQLCLSTPMYASHRALDDFLQRQKNTPPEGLDPALLEAPLDSGGAGAGSPSGGAQQQQLKDIVLAASQAFISVSQEPPVLDAAYLLERSRIYASAMNATPGLLPAGVKAGGRIELGPTPAPPPSNAAALAATALQTLLAAPPVPASEISLAQQLAAAAAAAAARPIATEEQLEPVVLAL